MLGKIQRVHFIGIGGYGMSALAKIILQMGYTVTGSDLKASPLTRSLEKQGATIYLGHDKDNIGKAQLVVYSTAIPQDNPEMKECRAQGITLWHRSDMLAKFINSYFGIAVAGTHGKTTTTSMLSLILEEGGLDPTALVGGEVVNFSSNARFGTSKYLVAEACESDHSFLRYYPMMVILTNIEADHLEHYDGDFSKLIHTYEEFLQHIKPEGSLIYCADDDNTAAIIDAYGGEKMPYSLTKNAAYTGRNLREIKGCYTYELLEEGRLLGEVTLAVPGKHNVYNSLGAAALARKLGIDFSSIKRALAQFRGAKRRFQQLGCAQGITVVDDYAHHPTEVKATLQAARAFTQNRVLAVFQPHRFTRLQYFMDDFSASFADADVVLLHDVYSAGEEPIPEVNTAVLRDKISRQVDVPVHHVKTHGEIIKKLHALSLEGDTVIFMGAGDITGTASQYYEDIKEGKKG